MTGAVAAADRRTARAGAACPYRGLVPYSVEDAAYFFGRGAEREIIAANLIASRLTLLYAASGVGKSSVLLAGVLHDLDAMAADDVAAGVAPEYVPVVVRRWREDPLGAVRDGVRAALGAGEPAGGTLADDLAAWTGGTDSTVLLILDQFEEFLLYHGDGWEPGDPAEQLARLLSTPGLPLNVLIALREDALAGLDRFKGRVPHLFENYLRLKHLDRRAAREAVEQPVAEWNRRHDAAEAVTLEPELVDAVLDQLGEGVALARGGGLGQTPGSSAPEIEAPFLQLVLMRVWEEERAAGSPILRAATLARLGGADRIVGTYLDDQMDRLAEGEQAVASAVFHQLVTPSGTKIAHSLGDLADYTGVPVAELRDVLDKLSAGDDWRILRAEAAGDGAAARTYEIFHDVLAEAVLDWRGRFEEQRAASAAVAAERSAARRRRRRLALAALGLGAAAAILLVVALISIAERRKADDARDAARSSRLVGSAQALLADDPELAILLTRRAGLDTPGAAPVLRTALTQYGTRGVLPSGGGRVLDIGASPDGKRLVGGYRDGHIRVWDIASATLVADRTAGRGGVTHARYSPDGARIMSVTSRGDLRLWRADDVTALHTLADGGRRAEEPRWSEDGRRVLAELGAAAVVWDARTGRRLRSFGGPRDPVLAARWATSSREVVLAVIGGLEVRSVRTGRARLSIPGRHSLNLRVSRDGSRLVAQRSFGGSDLVDLRSGAVRPLSGATTAVDVQFAPKSSRLALATERRVLIYDAADGRLENILPGAARAEAVRFAADERTLLTAGSDLRTVRVWDAKTGDQLAVLPGRVELTGLTATAQGQIVTTASDGAIRLWQPTTPRAAALASASATAESRFLGSRGVAVATAAGVEVRHAWSSASGAERLARGMDVHDLGVAPAGDRIAIAGTSSRDRAARVFEVDGGREIAPRLDAGVAREQPVAVAFSPDGRLIATADRDGAGSLWSAEDHTRVARLGAPVPGHPPLRGHVTFMAGGALLAVSNHRGAVRVYDVATRRRVRAFPKMPRGGDWEWAAPIVAQPGGDLLAVGGANGSTRLLNVRTGATIELPAVDEQILDLAFNPTGDVLATASASGALRVWDVRSGRSLGVVNATRAPLWSVDISADGASVLTLGDDDTARVFPCDVCGSEAQLLRAARKRVTRAPTAAELRRYDPDG